MKTAFLMGVSVCVDWADARVSLPEMVYRTTRDAIEQSGLSIGDVDSVVIASHDLTDGRSLSSMITATAAGGYLRDEVRLADDGAVAVALAEARIRSGRAHTSVVAAWGRASEGAPAAIQNARFEPFFSRSFGLNDVTVAALRAQQFLAALGHGAGEARLLASEARAARVSLNPRALQVGGTVPDAPYPFRPDELPRWADICVAAVLTNAKTDIAITGVGQSSEPYWIGDRDLVGFPALVHAGGEAMHAAGTAVDAIDAFELDGLTLFDEALACEALGLAPQGTGFAVMAGGAAINLSGGSAAGYCEPAMGLLRFAEAALQLRGECGYPQPKAPRRALATGSSVVASQTQTAIVLEKL